MSEWKYARRYRFESQFGDELDYLTRLNRFKAPKEVMDLVGKMEPNIFVTGGVARQAALMQISGIAVDELPETTDCDFLSFSEGGIYRARFKTPVAAIYVGYNRPFAEKFGIFLDKHTALTLDQMVMGTPQGAADPELFVTDAAVQAYQDRVVELSPYQNGDCRSTDLITGFSAVCRAAVMSEILRPQGFVNGVDPAFARHVLREGWSHPRAMGKIRSVVNKSKLHGVKEGLYDYFRGQGFTIPQRFVDEPPYVSDDEG
ncbi:hypothetical protein IPM65_04750 [Candidatus Roizmanbacteria bacterium]|nr:MAG: hypothetical protein IPM65_04750 [Candidatus Roizmanbacteria bacterium]